MKRAAVKMLFKGRMNRATYWTSLALIISLIAVFGRPSATGGALGVMFGMSVFRLHDLGRSGKWALAPFVLAVTAMFLSILLAARQGSAAATPIALFVVAIMALILGLLAWLGSLPGQPDDNRFGPAPKPGVTLFKGRRRSSTA